MKIINQTHHFLIKFFIVTLAFCALTANESAFARSNRSLVKTLHKQKTIQLIQRSSTYSLKNRSIQTLKANSTHKPEYLINKLRKNFSIKEHHVEHTAVQKEMARINRSKKILIKHTIHAGPHLDYVIRQVEKRNLPGELALLPMLESKFQPKATSSRGAAGIWQIMPSTGRRFGLKQNGKYDDRRDVQASTKAALNYLEFLHKKFKGDWMLALAAYNAGEGTIENAIKRNRKAGKPTSFWFLKLPKQTRIYVPKFLALAQVIKHH